MHQATKQFQECLEFGTQAFRLAQNKLFIVMLNEVVEHWHGSSPLTEAAVDSLFREIERAHNAHLARVKGWTS